MPSSSPSCSSQANLSSLTEGEYPLIQSRNLKVALRKLRSAVDRPYSSIEFSEFGLRTECKLVYEDELILRELRPVLGGDNLVIYDVGASYGYYASALAKLSNVKQVMAFEPLPDIYRQLVQNTKSSGKVLTYNIGLGSESGSHTFERSSRASSSSFLQMGELHKTTFPDSAGVELTNVRLARLDDIVESDRLPLPDVVKIECFGC